MYREVTTRDLDSVWRFLSGLATDEYMSNPNNHSVYDVNTIANYDPDIIPFLGVPPCTAFEREKGTGPFVAVHDFQPNADPQVDHLSLRGG